MRYWAEEALYLESIKKVCMAVAGVISLTERAPVYARDTLSNNNLHKEEFILSSKVIFIEVDHRDGFWLVTALIPKVHTCVCNTGKHVWDTSRCHKAFLHWGRRMGVVPSAATYRTPLCSALADRRQGWSVFVLESCCNVLYAVYTLFYCHVIIKNRCRCVPLDTSHSDNEWHYMKNILVFVLWLLDTRSLKTFEYLFFSISILIFSTYNGI